LANPRLEKENYRKKSPTPARGERADLSREKIRRLRAMYLSHVTITMPKGGEAEARRFYGGCLGLRELSRSESVGTRDGVCFDAGGLQLHVSVDDQTGTADGHRHFGLGCGDLERLRSKLREAGVPIEDGHPVSWKRFFIHDPFGNRIEIHQPGGLI
jgi:catechol 2,3-dioxygenase-like lactoylglutathione lyase family enzyme